MLGKSKKLAPGIAAAVIGGGIIAANGFLITPALAGADRTGVPVFSADAAANGGVPGEAAVHKQLDQDTVDLLLDLRANNSLSLDDVQAAIVTVNEDGKQIIVSNDLQRVLESRLKERDNAASAFVAGTPAANDLTELQAIASAKTAVVKEFALTRETLSRFSVHAALNVADPQKPVWSITLYPAISSDFADIGTYHIDLDSLSGEIIQLLSAADGVG